MDFHLSPSPFQKVNQQLNLPQKPHQYATKKVTLLAVAFIVTAIIASFSTLYLLQKGITKEQSTQKPASQSQTTLQPTPTIDPVAGWSTFTSKEAGFSFRYPPDYTVGVTIAAGGESSETNASFFIDPKNNPPGSNSIAKGETIILTTSPVDSTHTGNIYQRYLNNPSSKNWTEQTFQRTSIADFEALDIKGIRFGKKHREVFVTKGGIYYILEEKQNTHGLFETIISTITFFTPE